MDPPAPPASTQARPPTPPERLLLDQIAAGELDPHLTAIADAIHARLELLETINSAKALAMLNVGDRVRFNHHTRPQYLRGIEGIVTELDQHTATVCIHQPLGRFRTPQIRSCRCYSSACPQPPENEGDRDHRTTTNAELDSLIEEITVDCNDEEEKVLMGFEGVFDEDASFPCPGTVVGEPVEVLSISAGDQRRGLTATCQRADRSYEIALLDIKNRRRPGDLASDRRLPRLGHRQSDHATRLHPRRRDRHRRKPVLRDQHRPGPRRAPSSAHQRTGVHHRQHQADQRPRPRGNTCRTCSRSSRATTQPHPERRELSPHELQPGDLNSYRRS